MIIMMMNVRMSMDEDDQMSWQLQLLPSPFPTCFSVLPPPFFCRTDLTAPSKTSLRPSRVKALHS